MKTFAFKTRFKHKGFHRGRKLDILVSKAKNLYSLEFDDQIIFNFNNEECMGSETIGADLIEEEGIYKINYSIDGFKSSATLSIRK